MKGTMMFKRISLTLLAVVLLSSSGCSVFMAAKQPDYKNLSVLDKGQSRVDVVAELGAPILSEVREGNKVDIFKFVQGYSKANKTSRAIFHGVADVFSLGLWEVVGTPTEMIASGKPMRIEVYYDANDNVDHVVYLKEKQ